MDSKTPYVFEALPAPALHSAEFEAIKRKRCKKFKRRAFHFLAISAFLLWVGARHLRADNKVFRFANTSLGYHWADDDTTWPIPTDMEVDHCATWSDIGEIDPDISEDFPYSADASFELPVSADTLFLISRSLPHSRIFASGRVNYLQSDDVSDNIKVDITAYFWHDKYLDASKACLLTREDDQTGVGIFTKWEGKHRRHEHQKLRFDVTVTFPRTEDGSALAINRLLTDLPIFSQTFGDMSGIAFDKLHLKSALAGIRAETLSANNASIHTSLGPVKLQSLIANEAYIMTSNGPIEGTFNASQSLMLRTANGHIDVDVNLSNDEEDVPATLHMITSNGRISSNITLTSTHSSGSFNLTARTANAPLSLTIPSAPPSSNIILRATTALGPAQIALPATYEGAFEAFTSLASVSVKVDEKAEDPTGEGRERKVAFEQVGRAGTRGRVGWSEEGMGRGSIRVRTAIAPVILEL
ncbi:hypothetical protein B0H19DRAFT_991161 [Mycena capillaripes]|nr:hypothetical protein B0H19DRAFT_991161 [Mycena capillaripes]